MRRAPTATRDMLASALRRAAMLLGVLALVIASVTAVPASKTLGLFDTHHAMTQADCPDGSSGGCGSHGADRACGSHAGCVSIGILVAATAAAIQPHHQDWAVSAGIRIAGWADFPAKPPPIVRS